MPIRRRAWLTREGWYYLAVLLFIVGGAVLRSVNLLVMLAGMMIAPLLFNWRLAMASLTGLVVRRRLPAQIIAGELTTIEIEVQNTRGWMSSWLLVVEDWLEREEERGQGRGGGQRSEDGDQRSANAPLTVANRLQNYWRLFQRELSPQRLFRTRATRAEALVAHVPTNGTGVGTYRLTLFRRGRYQFGPLRVSTRFPLGLVRTHFTLPAHGELIVTPQLGRLAPGWATLLEAEQFGDERRHPQQGTSEGDYYGLRPWQSGDSLRWIHWRTTAKLARPIVRQYERRRGHDVAIVLDPWLPVRPSGADEACVELAISLAATALYDIASRGHTHLTLAIAGEVGPCYVGPASPLYCEELLARLALIVPSHQVPLADALAQALEAAPRGARLLVVSPRPADHPSLTSAAAELAIDPEELAWIDCSSDQLQSLFQL